MPAKRSAPEWLFKPLSRLQEVKLLKLAAAAFKDEVARGRVVFPTGVAKSTVYETWRHGQQQLAVKRSSLKDCTQAHFRKLAAHFESMLDAPASAVTAYKRLTRTGPAKDSAPKEDTHEARELRLHKIREACEEADLLFPNYPAAICRAQFRRALGDATADQLQALFFTITQRARKRLAEADAEPAYRPPPDDDDTRPF